MISCFLCAIIIVGSDPPTLNPQTFGDRDPSTDAIHRVDRVAYMGLRDFSSALTRRELADDISNLPISGGQRQVLINCAKEIYPLTLRSTMMRSCTKEASTWPSPTHWRIRAIQFTRTPLSSRSDNDPMKRMRLNMD